MKTIYARGSHLHYEVDDVMAVASSAGVGFAATASTLKDNASLRWDAVVGPIAAILRSRQFFL